MRHTRSRMMAVVGLVVGLVIVVSGRQRTPETWVTAWATSHHAAASTGITNATVRMIARPTIAGSGVRIRLANTFGPGSVTIGKAYVGRRNQGAALVPGSNRQLTFDRERSVSMAPGGEVVSDPVPMNIFAQEDLAISLHIEGADVKPSQHNIAQVTSYMTATGAGDVAADETRAPFTETTTSTLWLKGVDVLAPATTGAVVVFGDSITDGSCSTLDGYDRWPDFVALRLHLLANGGQHAAVINEGIAANTITREHLEPPPSNTPGLERLERDLFSHSGVSHLLLFLGTNDINRGASAAQVTAGIQEIARRVKARGIKIVLATLIPRHNSAPGGRFNAWTPAKTRTKNEVNTWIRSQSSLETVLDFDKVVRDPMNTDLLFAPFNCDGTHPNQLGYLELASAVRLGS